MNEARLIRDLDDGILALDKSGTIVSANPSALRLLGVTKELCGEKYLTLMQRDAARNDEFHQMLLDAVADKAMVLSKLMVLLMLIPFVDWSKYPLSVYLTYAVSVVGQEFVSRGVVYECMRRILPGEHNEIFAILVSSVIFGAVHVHVGFIYMVGAVLLLSVLGLMYARQGTIWGLCIPHYILGMALGLLGYVAY